MIGNRMSASNASGQLTKSKSNQQIRAIKVIIFAGMPIGLLKRVDSERNLTQLTAIPGRQQFLLMLSCPLEHHLADAFWSIPLNDDQRPNPNNEFPSIIDGMEARA